MYRPLLHKNRRRICSVLIRRRRYVGASLPRAATLSPPLTGHKRKDSGEAARRTRWQLLVIRRLDARGRRLVHIRGRHGHARKWLHHSGRTDRALRRWRWLSIWNRGIAGDGGVRRRGDHVGVQAGVIPHWRTGRDIIGHTHLLPRGAHRERNTRQEHASDEATDASSHKYRTQEQHQILR